MPRSISPIPATSVASEPLSSLAGDIADEKRNRLTPAHAELLTCLRANRELCLSIDIAKRRRRDLLAPGAYVCWLRFVYIFVSFFPDHLSCACLCFFLQSCVRRQSPRTMPSIWSLCPRMTSCSLVRHRFRLPQQVCLVFSIPWLAGLVL